MKTIRWGIISTGNMGHNFARGLQSVADADLVAVGSRNQASAEQFAAEFDIPNAHGSYQELADNPDVDVVYIGTPHVFHAENTLMCLEAGKHVLCEKPFTINADEARQCVALARENNLFLMEAIWMRFIPAFTTAMNMIREGKIGEITLVQADFSFYLPFDPQHRLFNLDLGGGALLDVGIYPISFVTSVLGLPQKVHSNALIGKSGVDEQANMLFDYADGVAALLSAGINGDLRNHALVKGTTGKIIVHKPFWRPSQLTVHLYGEEPKTIDVPFEGNGYNYEAIAVQECIRTGRIEHDTMPHDETIATMQLMDTMRKEWRLCYPQEV